MMGNGAKFFFVDCGLRRVVSGFEAQAWRGLRRSPPRIWSRRSVITPVFLNRSVFVYTGLSFVSLFVRSEMVGYNFGMFVMTKKLGNVIHRHRRSRFK